MKNLLLLLTAGVAALALRAQPAPPATNADAEYAAAIALGEAPPPGDPKVIGAAQYIHGVDENRQKLSAAAFAFYDSHPADPRRWTLVTKAFAAAPFFAQSFGPDVESKGLRDAVIDQAARAAWLARAEVVHTALLTAGDVPPDLREGLEWASFGKDFGATTRAKQQGQPFDYEPFKARFAAHLAKFAGQPVLPDRAADYLGALERVMPGQGIAGWKTLADSTDAAVHERAVSELAKAERLAALASQPFALAFTAADGRPVDVAQLRGKVVLIDFWATWCGPCVAELPNVKNVYAAYHDKGFEVVGISLENGQLAPKDTPEQHAAKLAKAKQGLTDFTAKNEMPWPQYFDGKWWKNEISTRYDITGIPAMFLLDQEGLVVSTNARGPKLEAEVKRLLKL